MILSTVAANVGYTLFASTGISYEIIQIVAFVFAILWLAMTLYIFLPFVQLGAVVFLNNKLDFPVELGDLIIEVDDEDLIHTPTIDVLIPAYNEGNVVEQAIRSLRETNYPESKLNINLLIEPDDENTAEKLDRIKETYNFDTYIIPGSYPGEPNKPRALNYGFNKTSGDVVGVIDAEDIVDSALFINVTSGLYNKNKDFVQAKLDMVNEDDGWKNLHFRGEYAYWYELLLKGFYTAGYPVPLGGTTNFFHRSVLEEVSSIRERKYGSPWPDEAMEWFEENSISTAAPWDPRNVTEDFELGLLLWLHGFNIGYLNVATLEESPIDYTNWITQRTRWEKGKIYTLFQWLRHPPKGLTGKFHLLFQSFIPHYAIFNITGVVILLLYSNIFGISLLDTNQLLLLLTGLIVGFFAVVHGFAYYIVSEKCPRWRRIIRSFIIAITLPLYWVLYWSAALRAIYQIYTGNLFWEKTDHHGRNIDN